jgi:hypothetical protein
VKVCAFCGRNASEAPLTKEHIFSRGLAPRVLPATTEPVARFGTASITAVEPDLLGGARGLVTTHSKHERPASPAPFEEQVKVVCGECNSGWMSRIDASAQELLAELVDLSPTRLVYRARATLAAWAWLKVVMCQYFFPEEKRGADADLRGRFWKDNRRASTPRLPPSSEAWLVKMSDERAHGAWAYSAPVSARREDLMDVVSGVVPLPMPRGFVGMLGVERVVLVAAGRSAPHGLPTSVQKFGSLPGCVRVWPTSPRVRAFEWPPFDQSTLEMVESTWRAVGPR